MGLEKGFLSLDYMYVCMYTYTLNFSEFSGGYAMQNAEWRWVLFSVWRCGECKSLKWRLSGSGCMHDAWEFRILCLRAGIAIAIVLLLFYICMYLSSTALHYYPLLYPAYSYTSPVFCLSIYIHSPFITCSFLPSRNML